VISWASVVGSGIAGALIAYPLMYYALAHRYGAKLSNAANLRLFVVTVPLIGIALVAFGGDSQSISGVLVLFGAPLLVCFIVIGAAFESRAARAKAQGEARDAPTLEEPEIRAGSYRFVGSHGGTEGPKVALFQSVENGTQRNELHAAPVFFPACGRAIGGG